MNEQSEHLSNAQIENYGNRPSDAGLDADQSDEEQRIKAHLDGCPSCRSHLLDFHRTSFGLLSDPQQLADLQVNTASTPDCPSEDDLRQLAAGLSPEAVGVRLAHHAATCDRCGQLLKIYTELFSDDFSPEEQAALADLKSSSAAWQKKTAREMLRIGALASRDARPRFMRQGAWKWAFASAFLLALVAGGAGIYPLLMLRKASLSVEAEYRKGRPMEYRVSGVPYGRFKRERSSPGLTPFIEVPNPKRVPLLAANAALLREDSSIAKSILQDALQDGKGSLPILNNLVVAYAMEADQTQSPADYQKALDMTGQILRQNSSDTAALFNRALILKRLGRRDESITTLKLLERVEQDSEWRQEAEEKLQLFR